MREAWSRATAGHRVLTLVGGEPGIGKTALTGELARLARADKGLVLYGRWDEHVLAPYQAFREALADYARACPEAVLRHDLGDLAGEIARAVPGARAADRAAPAEPLVAAEAERFRLFEALDTWIQRWGPGIPCCWCSTTCSGRTCPPLLLLAHLMQARRSTPLLAVAMYRDIEPERSDLSAVLHSLARDVDCRRLTLRGLDRDAVTALLEGGDRPGVRRTRVADGLGT